MSCFVRVPGGRTTSTTNQQLTNNRRAQDHYNPIIRAVAAGGDAERARAMIADAARRWAAYNAARADAGQLLGSF
jgi:hypothetical protein